MKDTLDARLDVHRGRLLACRTCKLPEGVMPIVSLARSPKIMLVGQAPGKVEAEGGKPFAGRAGRTLFRWLAQAGLDEETARRRIYIAAVTRCFPGPSPSGRGDRVPSNEEQSACSRWLEAELEMIRPKLLIPVGKLAIERFLPRLPLDQLIGREHEVTYRGGKTIAIPLPHPSGASSWIHTGNHPQLLTRALELLARELGRQGITTSRSVA